jgi:hypothetical protein
LGTGPGAAGPGTAAAGRVVPVLVRVAQPEATAAVSNRTITNFESVITPTL